jgi:guanosine-3',5'-bis(diphosphate) 3'-pyrophosphohydrolase
MMRQYELVERVQRYKPDVDEALLNKAYVYAMQKHGHAEARLRRSLFLASARSRGDPHRPASRRRDHRGRPAARHHRGHRRRRAPRSTSCSVVEIGKLVDGLTKLKPPRPRLQEGRAGGEPPQASARHLRRRARAAGQARRPAPQHAHAAPRAGRQARCAIAEETMEIYAPLAGAWACRACARSSRSSPSATSIPRPTARSPSGWPPVERARRAHSARSRSAVASLVEKRTSQGRGEGRQKKPWSIFRKMQTKALSFEQLSDLYGFRVIVRDRRGLLPRAGHRPHDAGRCVPGRFKDYISTPKQNDYRSIHTTIVGPSPPARRAADPHRDMNEIAEYGVAAHALYKDNGETGGQQRPGTPVSESRAYAWLRRTIDMLSRGDNPGGIPRAHQARAVPRPGVLLHAQGHADRAAARRDTDRLRLRRAHRRRQHLRRRQDQRPHHAAVTELANGDEVEIIRSKAQTPPAAWESIAVTGKARSAIRRATREAIRKQYGGLGRRILERAFERAGKPFSLELLKPVLQRLAQQGASSTS